MAELVAALITGKGHIPNPDSHNLRRFYGAVFTYDLRETTPWIGHDFAAQCFCGEQFHINRVDGMVNGIRDRNDPFAVIHHCAFALIMTDPLDPLKLLRITRKAR